MIVSPCRVTLVLIWLRPPCLPHPLVALQATVIDIFFSCVIYVAHPWYWNKTYWIWDKTYWIWGPPPPHEGSYAPSWVHDYMALRNVVDDWQCAMYNCIVWYGNVAFADQWLLKKKGAMWNDKDGMEMLMLHNKFSTLNINLMVSLGWMWLVCLWCWWVQGTLKLNLAQNTIYNGKCSKYKLS